MESATKPEGEATSLFAPILPVRNRFSQNLFGYLCLKAETNLVVSPLEISRLLALVAHGVDGQSLEELQSFIHLPKIEMLSYSGYKCFMDNFNFSKHPLWEILIVNQNGIAKTLTIDQKFIYSYSVIFRMDSTNVKATSDEVDTLYKEKTNGRVPIILTPSDVAEIPSVILLNAIYLRCLLDTNVDEKPMGVEFFRVSSKLYVAISMIHKRWYFNHGEIPEVDATFIVLPLTSDKQSGETHMKLMVFLPNELDGIKKLEQHLDTANFRKLLETSQRREIYLSLPKFRVGNSIDITSLMKQMGVEMIQNTDVVDLTSNSSTSPLHIDKIIQKAFLDVDEKGIEATSENFRCLRKAGPNSKPDVEFTVNRAFICAVVTEDRGIPIFMARITNPIS